MTDLAATGGLDAATINGQPLKQAVYSAKVDAASVDGWVPPVSFLSPYSGLSGLPLAGTATALPRRTYTDSLFRI